MTIKVAIAGGTAPQLGKAIVRAIQDYSDELQAIVLTRPSSKIPPWLEKLDVEIRRVDYNSEASLVEALKDVHTVSRFPIPLFGRILTTTGNINRRRRQLGASPKEPPRRQHSCRR
jgi:hypothetical protein